MIAVKTEHRDFFVTPEKSSTKDTKSTKDQVKQFFRLFFRAFRDFRGQVAEVYA